VAACPALTLLMSDSLNATVIVNLRVFTISTNEPLELPDDDEEEPVLPRLPAVVPELLDEEPDEPLLELLEAEELDPADTESPG
jgi:hypothetical protein